MRGKPIKMSPHNFRGSTLMTLRVSRGVTYDEGEAGAAREGRRIKIKVSYDATLVVVYYSSE